MSGNRLFAIALIALILTSLAACGQHSSRLHNGNVLNPQAQQQHSQDDSINNGPLPGVFDLDGRIKVNRAVSADGTITSQGQQAYIDGQTGTNGASGFNVEQDQTFLTLRAFAPGEYAYGVYGQAVGTDPKPLKTLINSDVCKIGGGRDDEIPLSYYVGIADYSVGAWRWFGPYGDVDVMVTVNSETLKSRFKSPSDNYYLAVLASNGSKAASALPDEGSTVFPMDLSARRASADGDDPGGLTIEEVVTWVEDNLLTDPAIVTGLQATADTNGVNLIWDTNPDPDVDIYQVFRADPDTTDDPVLLQGVLAPNVTYTDLTGIPGKNYRYLVRARNNAGYGGTSEVTCGQLLDAPPAAASVFIPDKITVSWPASEGAMGYEVYRADTDTGTPVSIAEVDSATLSFEDTNVAPGESWWYWVQAFGEDFDSVLGTPQRGFRHPTGSDIIWMFVSDDTVDVGDTITVTVQAVNLSNPMRYLNSVHISYDDLLEADMTSFDLGSPDGYDTKDGFWEPFSGTINVIRNLYGPFSASYTGAPVNTSFIECCIAPFGETYTAPPGSSGDLFNFTLTAVAPGEATLRFVREYSYGDEVLLGTGYSEDGEAIFNFDDSQLVTINVLAAKGPSSVEGPCSGTNIGKRVNSDKAASMPPSGGSNAVNDLMAIDNGDGTYGLQWGYLNIGDYDQDSMVRISDLVPIAVHFGEMSGPNNFWVDGDANTQINIADITPIGQHFSQNCEGYIIEGANIDTGPFTQIGLAAFSTASVVPRVFSFTTGAAYAYYRVVPYDYAGAFGEPSNTASP